MVVSSQQYGIVLYDTIATSFLFNGTKLPFKCAIHFLMVSEVHPRNPITIFDIAKNVI